jgi:glycosyltransferase involved in cell wall biosynthesis
MSRELGVPLHEIMLGGSRVRRLVASMVATFRLLRRERPAVVFGSNPSLVLTVFLLLTRRALGFRFVTDSHYGGIVAVNGGPLVQRLLDFVNARADVVIVTTEGHARRVRERGGTPFVFPDPLPQLPPSNGRPAALEGTAKSVLFICSFDKDEPFTEVFEAARLLEAKGFRVFASGRYARVGLTPEAVPHVRLMGYVDRATYDGMLRHSDVVLDLTTWEDCLVCGAYEAMVAAKPCVLSRTESLTGLFTAGTVFTSHAPAAIASSVEAAYADRERLSAAIPSWLEAHDRATRQRVSALRRAVGLPVAA